MAAASPSGGGADAAAHPSRPRNWPHPTAQRRTVRLRAHSLTLQPLIFDDWLVELLEELDVPEGIELHREPVASAVTVFIDPHRFRRAVINVYENALQATSAAPPSGRAEGGAALVACIAFS